MALLSMAIGAFGIVKRATQGVAPYGSRASLVLKVDIRPGHDGEIAAKHERLEQALTS